MSGDKMPSYQCSFSNGLQPLSLKPLPEDSYQNNMAPSSYSAAQLCRNEEGKEGGHKTYSQFIPKGLNKYIGMILTLIASLLFSIVVLIVKILNGPHYQFNSYSSSFWRYIGITIPAIPLVLYFERKHQGRKGESIFSTVWPLQCSVKHNEKWWTVFGLLSRGLLGGASVILRYFALEYLTIGDTAVITYATPVLVTVMAHFTLGEKCGVIPVVVAVITFIGVVIMTRPPFLTGEEEFDSNILIGTGLACGSLVCSSLIVIITRRIRNVHFSLMTLVFGSIGLLQAFMLTQIFQSFSIPSGTHDIIFVLLIMVLSFLGQMAIILALKCEQAGPVSLIRSCDVIFGFMFQLIFLGVSPDALSAVGGLIVLTCVTVTGMRKWASTLPQESKQRKYFKFLLL